MGILKEFSNLSSASSMLSNRGFSFSSHYLGDKMILWNFESIYKMEGFVMNQFFWDDKFASISKWFNAFVPQARTVWINVKGIPASCWCHSFFMQFGELCVNVTIGKKVFSAAVEEDEQVSHHWLSNLLGLVEYKSGLNQEGTCFDVNQRKVDFLTRISSGIDRMEARKCHDW
ncbi:hypothetical protein LWI28_013110 [Acer negundo]|uniref:DUF4283 domain-containing protein n=1 Tax=Acer negundo TaxID=4023 RepID=A0AAD5JJD1_ACENE|nr:hypothetical protein LWI28_013110 [Acer negundo]